MKIQDIMTRDLVTVSPQTPIHKAARLMADHGISGLPVISDEGRLVGVISEGDLILRQTKPEKRPWWRAFFDDAECLAREYQKAIGTTVGEVMTRSVISISPSFDIEVAATILNTRGIRRLPVVHNGQVVGIISRGDLVKALAMTVPERLSVSDRHLVSEMKARMEREPWVSAFGPAVNANDGVIELFGLVRTESEKSALETMARAIKGCRGVENQLVVGAELPYHYGF